MEQGPKRDGGNALEQWLPNVRLSQTDHHTLTQLQNTDFWASFPKTDGQLDLETSVLVE